MKTDDVERLAIAMFEAGREFCGEGAEDWKWEDAEQEGMRVYARTALAACAAENAELRETVEIQIRERELVSDWTRRSRQRIIDRTGLTKEVDDHRAVWIRMRELAAANATLDALREIFPLNLTVGRAHRLYVNDAIRATNILYPQPAALAKEKTNG